MAIQARISSVSKRSARSCATKARSRRPEVATTLRQMRALPGLTLQATTARDATSTHLYRLDLDTQFDRTTGVVRLSNRGTDEAGTELRHGPGHGQWAARRADEPRRDVRRRDRLRRISRARLARERRRRHGGRPPLVQRLSLALGSARGHSSIATTAICAIARRSRYARPVPKFERANLSLTAALDLDDLEILRRGERLRDERLRMLTVGPALELASRRERRSLGRHRGRAKASTPSAAVSQRSISRTIRGAPISLLSRLTFMRLHRLGDSWSVRLDALAQQTAYTLPYGERFKIGGDRLGPRLRSGRDRGRPRHRRQGRRYAAACRARRRVLRDVSLYGFYDIGAAWKNDAPGRESAATAGFGFATQCHTACRARSSSRSR